MFVFGAVCGVDVFVWWFFGFGFSPAFGWFFLFFFGFFPQRVCDNADNEANVNNKK